MEMDADALVDKGYQYLVDSHEREDYLQKALDCFEKADKQGNLEGSFFAGYMYYFGGATKGYGKMDTLILLRQKNILRNV